MLWFKTLLNAWTLLKEEFQNRTSKSKVCHFKAVNFSAPGLNANRYSGEAGGMDTRGENRRREALRA